MDHLKPIVSIPKGESNVHKGLEDTLQSNSELAAKVKRVQTTTFQIIWLTTMQLPA